MFSSRDKRNMVIFVGKKASHLKQCVIIIDTNRVKT